MVIFTSSSTDSFKYSWFYRNYTKLPGTFHFLTEPGLFCCALLQDAEERYGNVVLLQLSIDSTIGRKRERESRGRSISRSVTARRSGTTLYQERRQDRYTKNKIETTRKERQKDL